VNVTLVAFKSDGERQDFRVKGGRCVIGRKPGCELQIPVSTVSRQHCELVIDGDEIKLRDLGSSNGTFLNEVRVQEATLSPGDRLTIGPAIFTVQVNGEPGEIVPTRSRHDDADDTDTPATLPKPVVPVPDSSDDSGSSMSAPAVSDSDDDEEEELGKLIADAGESDDSSVFDFDFDLDENNGGKDEDGKR